MQLYPAIDIRDGKAVRLTRGHFDQETVYADDPLEAARAWVDAGARRLHVVDLDGARDGRLAATRHVERIAAALDVPLQCGGGLRSLEAIDAVLAAGAQRVVMGTAAFVDPPLLDAALAAHGQRVAVGLDVRGGQVATAAWTQTVAVDGPTAAARLAGLGVGTIVFTVADRDGTLEGPDLEATEHVAAAMDGGEVICSGGVGTLEHLSALRVLGHDRVTGVIVGKALYERRFTVEQAAGVLGDMGD